MLSPLIEQLINALRCLPSVGPKTAQRMAFNLLQHNRANGFILARILEQALQEVAHCVQCNTLSEISLCRLCSDPRRDTSLLCVVETPVDVIALEHTGNYKGLYFVLMGHLSPLDGIGPKELGMDKLFQYVQKNSIQEIILATNTTVEGEATAHYIATMVSDTGVRCSRIGCGVPVGGELEYLDPHTLARAFATRVSC